MIDDAYQKLPPEKKRDASDSKKAKIEDYTDTLISEMKPQIKFALTP
jgi:hypothetical protein